MPRMTRIIKMTVGNESALYASFGPIDIDMDGVPGVVFVSGIIVPMHRLLAQKPQYEVYSAHKVEFL